MSISSSTLSTPRSWLCPEDEETAYEGCLSFPGHNGAVTALGRSRSVPRTAMATGLSWRPTVCWAAASSTRTTTWTV